MDLGLNGRTAFVTGSWRGTGAGIAEALAREGCRVLLHGIEAGQTDAVLERLQDAGHAVDAIVGDPSSDSGLDELDDVLGEVEILVNNWGAPMKSSWDSIEHWGEEWNRNVLTGVRTTQTCLPGMRSRGWGRVVFVGTVGSRMPGRRNPGYYAAKSGLHGLVRSLAQEVEGEGITVNLVSPGMIATDEVREAVTRRAERAGVTGEWPEVEAWAAKNTATNKMMPNLTGRIPTPLDIGRVVAFTVSEVAWHITGADIAVDGGAVDARG